MTVTCNIFNNTSREAKNYSKAIHPSNIKFFAWFITTLYLNIPILDYVEKYWYYL